MTWQDITPILSVMIAAAAFYFARKKETQSDTAQITEAITKIDVMSASVADLRSDVKALRDEYRKDHDDLVVMRGKVDALGNRVDELRAMIHAPEKKG